MTDKRQVEIFSAGCPLCRQAEDMVRSLAGEDCQVVVRDMHQPQHAARAQQLGVRTVPAVAVDGKLAPCCAGRGPLPETLREALQSPGGCCAG